ncbi:MAG TPA: AtpZ/AtpI family protein [Sphingomicrobium sp.]|nr:AtpZ/AtpI family protein [Sphingomicrobium sp.]
MAEDDTEEVPKLPPDARLESLDERLDRLRRAEAEKANRAQGETGNRAGGLVVNQLIGGPIGGAVVGWLLDRWFGTAPWLMLVLMFVGFAGGFINVIRISNKPRGNAPDGQE